jgi:teichoic acid transport system permease protein
MPFLPRRGLPVAASAVKPPSNLKQLSVTPPLRQYVRDAWQRRQFAVSIASGERRAKHMNTALGGLWNLLNPLLSIGVYWLIFGVLLGTRRGVENFLGFLAVGIFTYHYSQRSFTGGANSIANNLGLIRSLQFPRALLPASAVLREAYTLRSAAIVIVAVLLLTGEGVTVTWLLIFPILVLQSIFNLGGALILARFADRIRDISNVLPFVFRLVFYLSGVLFLVDRFVDDPALKALFVINPFYSFISLAREYLMTTLTQDGVGFMWLSIVCWSLGLFTFGLLYFRSGEGRYGRG